MCEENSSNVPELDAIRNYSGDISSFGRISKTLVRIETRFSKFEIGNSRHITSVVNQTKIVLTANQVTHCVNAIQIAQISAHDRKFLHVRRPVSFYAKPGQ
ncbi:hypothetical protein DPMN_135666 [Dreissena polymorpha]|uniref:Uncharacterized protein n=1 Tax=Dreissena polymorpha TaxID=45954 RepID=A0A9D4G1D8_DREPO|nr:hypothetical protein DPMN_135666 [Dreissena polymorpha]